MIRLWLLMLLRILTVASMVREEEREVIPEVRLCFHLPNDVADMLVEVLTQRPHADRALLRAKGQVSPVAGELHFSDVKDRVHLCSSGPSADFVHQDGRATQISLVRAEVAKVAAIASARQVPRVPR